MNEEEIREHAERLIDWHNEEYEYCSVYEDDGILEEIEDLPEEEQDKIMRQIHQAMYSANVTVTWND